MDRFEMIEKLRERADISYEEAAQVLDEANGDLLEALMQLERRGRLRQTGAAAQAGQSTAAAAEASVPAKKREKGPAARAFHAAGNFLAHTAFHITHKEKEIFVMPSWTFALLMFFFWHTLVPVMLISLFFNVRYFFDGSEDTASANELLEKMESFADGFENGMKKDDPQRADAAQEAAAGK